MWKLLELWRNERHSPRASWKMCTGQSAGAAVDLRERKKKTKKTKQNKKQQKKIITSIRTDVLAALSVVSLTRLDSRCSLSAPPADKNQRHSAAAPSETLSQWRFRKTPL